MNYPIQALWNGPMTDMEILCLKSWVGHGHPVHLYTYEDLSGLPLGVEIMDARDIIPEDDFELYRGPMPKTKSLSAFSYMPFADRFRYALLRMNGGLWLDLDIILIKSIPTELFDLDFWCSSERTIQAGQLKAAATYKPNIGAIYCKEPESDLMVELTNIHTPLKSPWDGLKWFGKWVQRLGLAKGVLQPSTFCDVDWFFVRQFHITLSVSDIFPAKLGHPARPAIPPSGAIGIHCWRGLLRQKGIPYGKADVLPLSYLGRLYKHAEDVYRASGAGATEGVSAGAAIGDGCIFTSSD